MESKMIYGEATSSKLVKLLDLKHDTEKDSHLTVSDYKAAQKYQNYKMHEKSYEDFQHYFIDRIPYVESRLLTPELTNNPLFFETYNQKYVYKVMEKVLSVEKCKRTSTVLSFIECKKFPQVTFTPTKIIKEKQNRVIPPSLKFVIPPASSPNTMMRINSGYILDLKSMAREHKIENGKIVAGTRPTRQEYVVIVPQFVCSDSNVVPMPVVVDPTDKNIFYLVVNNSSTVESRVNVYFHAMLYDSDVYSHIKPTEPNNKIAILKARDSATCSRGIFNLKCKVMFNKMNMNRLDKHQLIAPLYDGSKHTAIENGQYIKFDRCSAFFTTRRRNWYRSGVYAMPGYFAGNGDGTFISPVVHEKSVYNQNTHCVTLLTKRTNLFSEHVRLDSVTGKPKLNVGYTILNGANMDLPHYKDLVMNMRKASDVIQKLALDYEECRMFIAQNQQFNEYDLMLLRDHDVSLNAKSEYFVDTLLNILKLKTRTESDKSLFMLRRKSPKSVRLYNAMWYLYRFVYETDERGIAISPDAVNDDTSTTSISTTLSTYSDAALKTEAPTMDSTTHDDDDNPAIDSNTIVKVDDCKEVLASPNSASTSPNSASTSPNSARKRSYDNDDDAKKDDRDDDDEKEVKRLKLDNVKDDDNSEVVSSETQNDINNVDASNERIVAAAELATKQNEEKTTGDDNGSVDDEKPMDTNIEVTENDNDDDEKKPTDTNIEVADNVDDEKKSMDTNIEVAEKDDINDDKIQ
ncbi:gp22-like protein [Phenacoccus solenopsis nudivirus]|nr:gp22-like protein [Phenacoccus solenopsis nudivirus]